MRKTIIILLVICLYAFGVEVQRSYWENRYGNPEITSEVIDLSIEQLRAYFLNIQTVRGDFEYEINLSDGQASKKNNSYEQMFAFRSLCGLLEQRPTEPTRRCALLAIDFNIRNIRPIGENSIMMYCAPGVESIDMGTDAEFCLGLADFIRINQNIMPESTKVMFTNILKEHLRGFQKVKLDEGWSSEYDCEMDIALPACNPASDSIILEFYCRMFKDYGHGELLPIIEKEVMRQLQLMESNMKYGIDPAILKSSVMGNMRMLDAYVLLDGKNKEQVRDGMRKLCWWLVYKEWLDVNESQQTRMAMSLLPVLKVLSEEDRMVVESLIVEILGKGLRNQVGGQYWIQEDGMIVGEKCNGGILAKRNSKVVKISEASNILQILLSEEIQKMHAENK